MALDKIQPTGETGETARVKINASFDKIDSIKEDSVIKVVMKTADNGKAFINIIDEDDNNAIRASIQYEKNGALGSELILETRDSSGTLTNIMLMGANGHIINPSSGDTIQNEHDLVTAKMLTEPFRMKADLSYVDNSVINEYSGIVPPLAQTGKSNDIFHQYPTQVDTTIQSGLALHDYNHIILSFVPRYKWPKWYF